MVRGYHAVELFDVVFDVVDGDAEGHGLEEDAGGGFAEGNGGGEDDESDDEGDRRIAVVPEGPGREPNYESGGDDADVAESVTHDMQEDAAHVQVGVGVAAAVALFGLGVLVVFMGEFGGGRFRGDVLRF